jgi:hypothetical protein
MLTCRYIFLCSVLAIFLCRGRLFPGFDMGNNLATRQNLRGDVREIKDLRFGYGTKNRIYLQHLCTSRRLIQLFPPSSS